MTRIFAGVYWGARQMDLADCAVLAKRHFDVLAETSPKLQNWYFRANRRPKTPTQVDVSSEAVLADLLAAGVNRRDIGGELIPELGWHIGFWNGDAGAWSSGTDIHCGLYTSNPNLSNCAILSITGEGPADIGRRILRNFIEIWDPDNGVARRQDEGGEQILATYTTAGATRLFGRGERVGRGRLTSSSG